MYYVFVLFIGCYRANLQNLQNIPLLHLSEAAVSPVWQRLFTKEEFYKLKYCSTVVYMVPRA